MTIAPSRVFLAMALGAAAATALASCAAETEYHGHTSGIDGVLWRQVAFFEDPLSTLLYSSMADGPVAYLDALDYPQWDERASSASELALRAGGLVLYRTSFTQTTAEVSVFITSGPRPAEPRDDGGAYSGPSQVYTCYTVQADFAMRTFDQVALAKCPRPLVELLPEDAAFASAEVFAG